MKVEHLDVLIVGAGLSGIAAGYYLGRDVPDATWAIVEARDELGGTWSFFRYPGLRSDSDMTTLGYRFRPWTGEKAIADGASILSYVRDTAREYGIDRKIRYGLRVRRATWSSVDGRWMVEFEDGAGAKSSLTCSVLYGACGYYRYDHGYTPDYPGLERYRGRFVHPQDWPADLDHRDLDIVVIGSGATAVTLVPALAETARHVVMLQRSPTYVVTVPERDQLFVALKPYVGEARAFEISRWKNIAVGLAFFQASRRFPRAIRELITSGVRRQLPPDFDVEKHFKPHYDPWDQRVCAVPEGDLFRALRSGKASVTTDTIDTFTESGLELASGEELRADVIVSATGLELLPIGGIELVVDGKTVRLKDRLTYRGMMLSDVPNFAFAIGYTNASWTLKVDLSCEHLCRLIRHARDHGYRAFTPVNSDRGVIPEPILEFTSTYVRRAVDAFPRQGSKAPWRVRQNYLLDLMDLRRAPLHDGVLHWSR